MLTKSDTIHRPRAPRVVLDTNIYISALTRGGIPREIIILAQHGLIKVGISTAIISEIKRVLTTKFDWPEHMAHTTIRNLEGYTQRLVPRQRIQQLSGQAEPDNRILEAALALSADAIVSGDHHLLDLGKYKNISILTPREFVLWLVTHR